MLFGIILVLAGIFLFWQVSSVLGGLVLVGGVVMVGLQFVQDGPPPVMRDYQSSAPTYNLRSSTAKR